MDRATVERYETDGGRWVAARRPVRRADAIAFRRTVARGRVRLDVGAGAGRYTGDLGRPVIALDAAEAMLRILQAEAPHALAVRADLEALPFRRAAAAGAWANMSYQHIPSVRLPMALAELHRALEPGSPVELQLLHGAYEGHDLPGDDIGGRLFASWGEQRLVDVVTGAGFAVTRSQVNGDAVQVAGRRQVSLADTVGPGMRILVCGLNPSVFSAERGVGYARPGNRFWPAAREAGLVTRDRDAVHALTAHGVGMTDLCKRPTVASAELSVDEYREGAARVARMVAWLEPRAVCFVGFEGYRVAVDRHAVAGVQPAPFGGRPAYVLPSTSGLNARTRADELVAHLRAAADLGSRA